MAASRKLQGEIDRCLKKVTVGVETFEDIWQKVHNAANSNQKEKYEADLKKEIKKLQRLRDQIKSWIASAEIKDKSVLMENRKLIETQMERFKVVERETKTKAYSKEGLGAAQKLDPAQKEREEVQSWLVSSIEALNIQCDAFECEIESLLVNKKKKLDKEKQERVDECKGRLERHRFHIRKLETLLRMLDNMSVEAPQIKAIKDDVEFYIESNQEPDFEENEYIYDDIIGLDDVELSGVGLPSSATTDSNETGGTPTSIISGSSPLASPLPVTTASSVPAAANSSCTTNHDDDISTTGSNPLSTSSSAAPGGASTTKKTFKDSSTKPIKPQPVRATSATLNTSLNSSGGNASSTPTTPNAKSTSLSSTLVSSTPSKGQTVGGRDIVSPVAVTAQPISAASSGIAASSTVSTVSGQQQQQQTGAPAPPPPGNFAAVAAAKHNSADSVITNAGQTQQQTPTSSAAGGHAQGLIPQPTIHEKATVQLSQQQHQQQIPNSCASPVSSVGSRASPVQQLQQSASTVSEMPVTSISSMSAITLQSLAHSAAMSSAQGLGGLMPQQQQNVSQLNGGLENKMADMSLKSIAQQVIDRAGLDSSSMLDAGSGGGSGGGKPPTSASTKSEACIPPLLGVAPLGAVPLQKEHQQQFQMMEAAYYHMPQPCDSEKIRTYLPRTPCITPSYYPQQPLANSDTLEFYQRMATESLFFAFYYMEGTRAQYLAAKALKKQSWRFHTKYMMWFQRHEEPKVINEEYEQGTYIYFDYEKWGQRKKEGFTFEYKYLEDRDLN